MNTFPIPNVLQCLTYSAKSYKKNSRLVKDYEIDLYIDGQRDMYIDGKYYKITSGSTVFRKPNQYVESYGDYNCYTLTLDFSKTLSIPQNEYDRNRVSPAQPLCQIDIIDCIPDVFIPEHKHELALLMKKIESCSYPNTINPTTAKSHVAELLFLLLADAMHYNSSIQPNTNKEKKYIQHACRYVKENYSQDITVADLARQVCLNENYFIRLFKNQTGMTPNKYIMETRLFFAKHMLMETDLSVNEIASCCGFNTPSYFSEAFKKAYSKNPLEYRKYMQ